MEVATNIGHTPSKAEFINECGTQRYVHLIYKVFGSWKEAILMMGMEPKEPAKGGYRKYDDCELLEYLRQFAESNKKIPTATDFKRGLLPSFSTYTHRFGSIENARQEAGVYNYVEEL
jgi:hypothetical protein